MVEVIELCKSGINASIVAQFIYWPGCFVGWLEKIHPKGKMLILSDGKGKSGTIELMEPLKDEISGIVEIVGRLTAKVTIMCTSFVQFKEDNYLLIFDAVKIIDEFLQFFTWGLCNMIEFNCK
ncbi:replication protein A 14 kDa subunit-like [Pteropus medius]|uniref:replication protein A 14 kDa subunit-like n=1 Tax=Pteropus vampyrus TaxID=132908 RepID=UPI00196B90E6|nr:replication protein A 14 kDa subunit-like [Pteropus giganteus]